MANLRIKDEEPGVDKQRVLDRSSVNTDTGVGPTRQTIQEFNKFDPDIYGIEGPQGPTSQVTTSAPIYGPATPVGSPPVEPGGPVSPTSPLVDPKVTVNSMLDDPAKFLTENNLNQTYVPPKDLLTEEQLAGEVEDPSKSVLGERGDLAAETATPQADVVVAEDVKTKAFGAALINPADLTKAIDEIAKLEPMKAASMAAEMDELLAGMEDGNVPLWARPAVAQVEQMLSDRGISASSVGRDSLFNAIIQAAMPIAQQDASFKQDSYKTNYNAKVQAVLSDVNMEFSAKQFNATSINQTNQFRAQLQVQVDSQNATRQDAMATFNSTAAARTEEFNTTQANSMTQVSSQLQEQRSQFNANMSAQIEQSNVNWRRKVNSETTAGVNAVNQANVQNAFNLSNQALTFLWQETRDEAHWENQATESEKDRKNQLEATLLASEAAMGGEIGKTIENLLNGSNFVSSFLDSWG